LTFSTTNATPLWSADGKYVYYTSIKPVSNGDETTVFRRPADGSREAESLLTLSGRQYLKGILPDGETVVLDSNLQTINASINKVLLKPGSQIVPVISHTFNERAAALSPDGRWLAYQSSESGRNEIYARDLSQAGGRWSISTAGGQEPRWSADGRELYYRNNGVMMVAPIDTHAGFQAGTPKTLFNEVYDLRSNSGETYDVDPRSGRFLLIRPAKEDVSSAQVRIVVNWFSELRKLAPAN
jgi:serine/threonine-protein kinase